MPPAQLGDTVKIHYTGKLENGDVFDSSADREPLQFQLGESQVIPGFEEAVIGMNQGDNKTVHIAPDQAYGPRQEEMVFEIAKSQLGDVEPEVGQRFQVKNQNGQTAVVVVTAVAQETVTLDGNHPLAGKTLIFEIDVVEIA